MTLRPLLMLSLPNSGSSWLAREIADHLPGCNYYGEFFNPLRNPKYEGVLARQFGCELASCYRNIAEPGDERIDDDIRATWGREDFTFTKEVFSPFKLEAFCRHFSCFVLLRSAELTFPPTRIRVWSFYEHAWFALKESGFELKGGDARSRSLEAHSVMTERVRSDAERLGVPVIDYEELFGERQIVEAALDKALGSPNESLVSEIVNNRRERPRPKETSMSLGL